MIHIKIMTRAPQCARRNIARTNFVIDATSYIEVVSGGYRACVPLDCDTHRRIFGSEVCSSASTSSHLDVLKRN